jgi:hypothetical protein
VYRAIDQVGQVMGGDTNGWSLDLNAGKPTFCYNLAAAQITHIRADQPLTPGTHTVRFEFEVERMFEVRT